MSRGMGEVFAHNPSAVASQSSVEHRTGRRRARQESTPDFGQTTTQDEETETETTQSAGPDQR